MQKSFIGAGSLNNLRSIIDKNNAKKVLIVTGKKSFPSSGAQAKIKKILSDTEVIIFDDFQKNPQIKDVMKGVQLVQSENPDLIVSIGGGSVIDMSKLIGILKPQSGNNYYSLIKSSNIITTKCIPLVAVPTTFGSGSEATHFAVVYINKEKFSLAHDYILPDYSILDPELSYSVPKNVAASCSIDALSQAVESYWSVKSTHKSRMYAKKSISLILPILERAVQGDRSAIFIMLKAANLSGRAINITTTTAPHALSYALTQFHQIPHGHAVALTLGHFFIINSNFSNNKIIDPRGGRHLKEIMMDLFIMFGVSNANECFKKWQKIMKSINLEVDFYKLGINSNAKVNKIISNINSQRLKNNPVKVEKNEMIKIITNSI